MIALFESCLDCARVGLLGWLAPLPRRLSQIHHSKLAASAVRVTAVRKTLTKETNARYADTTARP